MNIIRRAVLAGFGVLLLSAPMGARALSTQDTQDISRVEAYLNGITTLKAHFL
jgi:hypothetical protein